MDAVELAVSYGVAEQTARAVIDAYRKVARQTGRSFDPSTWSKTVWLAERDRCERASDTAAHVTLLLHLNRLREGFEEKADRGARGWEQGPIGERLTKR